MSRINLRILVGVVLLILVVGGFVAMTFRGILSHPPEQRAKVELHITFEKLKAAKDACGSFPKPEYLSGGGGDCFDKANLSKIRMKDWWGNEYGYYTDGDHLFLKTTYPIGLIIDETGSIYVAPKLN